MSMEAPKVEGHCVVVDAHELSERTSSGWALLKVLDEDRQELVVEDAVDPRNSTQTSSYGVSQSNVIRLSKMNVLRTHRYLLTRSSDASLAEALQNLAKAKQAVSELQSLLKEEQTKAEAAARLAEEAMRQVSGLDREVSTWKNAKEQAAGQLAKETAEVKHLKTILGKVWAAVGDVQMAKIVGDSEQNPDPRSPEETQTLYDRLLADRTP